jgi:ABC-type Fe3+-hydroxamate transport system substrate-binding protein
MVADTPPDIFPELSPFAPAPATVISLVPSVTESLFDLDLGNRVLAVTDYCVRPADKVQYLPKIGGTKNPDVAQIIALRPELVIANQEENRPEDVAALREAGIPVWVTFPRTVSDAFNLLWSLMTVLEHPVMSERVRWLERSYDWVISATKTRETYGTLPRVFVPIWLDPLMTFNAETYAHDLLLVCGGVNVFADRDRRYPLQADLGQIDAYTPDDSRVEGRDTRYPRVTWDEIQAAQPDIILLPSEPFAFDDSHVEQFALLDVPAAKNGRIHLVDGELLFWHGTRIGFALQALPGLLNPEGESYDG